MCNLTGTDKLYYAIAAICLLIVLIALLPLLNDSWVLWCPAGIGTLEQASQYYAVIAGVAAALIPITALWIGHMHFSWRAEFDQRMLKQSRDRTYVRQILDYVEIYHECLGRLFHQGYRDIHDLDRIRMRARSAFENVVIWLESEPDKSIFSSEERRSVLELHSIVDTKIVLSYGTKKELDSWDATDFQDRYFDYYKRVRAICTLKLVQLVM